MVETKDRKIGMRDWVQIRKWHVWVFGISVVFMGNAIACLNLSAWDEAIFFGIMSFIGVSFLLIRMARDTELNEKNGVKRFWFKF